MHYYFDKRSTKKEEWGFSILLLSEVEATFLSESEFVGFPNLSISFIIISNPSYHNNNNKNVKINVNLIYYLIHILEIHE